MQVYVLTQREKAIVAFHRIIGSNIVEATLHAWQMMSQTIMCHTHSLQPPFLKY